MYIQRNWTWKVRQEDVGEFQNYQKNTCGALCQWTLKSASPELRCRWAKILPTALLYNIREKQGVEVQPCTRSVMPSSCLFVFLGDFKKIAALHKKSLKFGNTCQCLLKTSGIQLWLCPEKKFVIRKLIYIWSTPFQKTEVLECVPYRHTGT